MPEFLMAALREASQYGLIWLVLVYLYLAVVTMLLARKMNMPNPWVAWVPVGGLLLLCQIARKPDWWVYLLFVPYVNLIFYVMLWMAVAEDAGKPAWLGLLSVVPVIGLVIPVYLAVAAPYRCPSCAAPGAFTDAFCGSCGRRLDLIAGRQRP